MSSVIILLVVLILLTGYPASQKNGIPFGHMFKLYAKAIHPPMWPGMALFDYDSDGDLDIYMTNGDGYPNGLFRNDGRRGFQNVAAVARVNHLGGTGVVTGDIDNDGYADLFVAGYSSYKLYSGGGGGTFADITKQAGLDNSSSAEHKLATSAAFCDVDNDGFVDLYVGRMADGWTTPRNELYRNNGNRTFTQIAEEAGVDVAITRTTYEGVGTPLYTTWAVVCLDFDSDGDQDLLAAVDFSSLALFRNEITERGKLHFTNVSFQAGLSATGNWMGLAVSDFDGDGWPDIFATNWGTSPYDRDASKGLDTLQHALYKNNGDGTFLNVARAAGVASWEFGWGASPVDWDNDGDVDLYYAGNMAFPYVTSEGSLRSNIFADDNPGHLFLNNGDGTFKESSAGFGLVNRDAMGRNNDARAVAAGDLNDDGFFEILVGNSAVVDISSQTVRPGIPTCFENPGNSNRWLKVRLTGERSNRYGIGARVIVATGSRRQVRDVRSGSSFQSQDSIELGIGLGHRETAMEVTVFWPSGRTQSLFGVKSNQTVEIVEPR